MYVFSAESPETTAVGPDRHPLFARHQKNAWVPGHPQSYFPSHTHSSSSDSGSKKPSGRCFPGQVEADEAYIGGLEKNKHEKKKLHAGRGSVGKKTVVAIKERGTKRVKAVLIEGKDYGSILRVVLNNVFPGSKDIYR